MNKLRGEASTWVLIDHELQIAEIRALAKSFERGNARARLTQRDRRRQTRRRVLLFLKPKQTLHPVAER